MSALQALAEDDSFTASAENVMTSTVKASNSDADGIDFGAKGDRALTTRAFLLLLLRSRVNGRASMETLTAMTMEPIQRLGFHRKRP